ncbi:oxidative damage protection protein [Nevskia ramosa]|uniref:oxidative damage protection protein n=1 Tax=Nevskia ramosa TaxID=64002 RepID=UPI001FDF0725|nr:oxidative damage protection protein [Nevskia ramosa]
MEAEGLPRPPVPGDLGQRIYEQVSKQAWAEWIAHQTRLINEMRLSLAEAESRKLLMTELEKFFFGGGELTKTSYIPPKKA